MTATSIKTATESKYWRTAARKIAQGKDVAGNHAIKTSNSVGYPTIAAICCAFLFHFLHQEVQTGTAMYRPDGSL